MLIVSIYYSAPSVRKKYHRVPGSFALQDRKAFFRPKNGRKNYVPFFEIEFFQYTKAFLKASKIWLILRSIFKISNKLVTVKRFLRKKVDFLVIFVKSPFLCGFSCSKPVFSLFCEKFEFFGIFLTISEKRQRCKAVFSGLAKNGKLAIFRAREKSPLRS